MVSACDNGNVMVGQDGKHQAMVNGGYLEGGGDDDEEETAMVGSP